MATNDVLFNEADVNGDGFLSENEFRSFLSRNSGANIDVGNLSVGSDFNNSRTGSPPYGSSAYRSTMYETGTSSNSVNGDINYAGGDFVGTNYGSSAYQSSIGGEATNLNLTNVGTISGGDAALFGASSASQSSSVVHQYETDAQGNFKDSNPQVIRRPAQNGPINYSQNIKVRFFQPPAPPPPGPLIIKEVRPPQPPAPAPLRIRQQAPPLPQQPPMILRERPPLKPASVASQTVVRNLPPIPLPPRSVVIERIPPAPPKPRDIIIERWLPYGPMAQRKTIVQRAEAAKAYQKPRNIILQYESPQVRVIRQFQRFGVTLENPEEYIRRYGATLFDTPSLLQQVRAAGVVEDISVPAVANASAVSTSGFSSSSSAGGQILDTTTLNGLELGGVTGGGGSGGGSSASFYETSYSGGGNVSGTDRGLVGINNLFKAVDTNNDGVLSPLEFHNAGF